MHGHRGTALVFALVALLVVGTATEGAQSANPAAEPNPSESPESPRASLRAFAQLTVRNANYRTAARYLTLSADLTARGPELAERLRLVLEPQIELDIARLSPLAEGDLADGFSADTDQLGVVPDGSGGFDPVFVVRTRDEAGAYWAFSSQTVSNIDAWYEGLGDRWIRELLPVRLLGQGPLGLLWWQWLALPVLALLAFAIGRPLGSVSRFMLQNVVQQTATPWDNRLLLRVAPSLGLVWTALVAQAMLPWLALRPPAQLAVRSVLAAGLIFAITWTLWRSVAVLKQVLLARPWAADNPSARSLLMVGASITKALLVVLGVFGAAAAFGYPLNTVLAGLGIGGIAVALGAQKMIENLFGSLSLGIDQPFHVNDLVTVDGVTGTVERVGMRSTRIRTLDRTLVTIPNGKLADMRIESLAARERIRLAMTLSLGPSTTSAQATHVIEGVKHVLRSHPRIWPDTVIVALAGVGPSSWDIEIVAWFGTANDIEFRGFREEVLLAFVSVIQEAGTSLAWQPRTVQLVTGTLDS